MHGWAGKILDINLSTGAIHTLPLDMEMARLFLGGRGLGARLLWDLVGPEVEPLSAQNVLIFATGPLTGTGSQTSNRFSVTTKSPLTGTVLDANSGGWWGRQFKRTGYDALIVQGKATQPVQIFIGPDGARLRTPPTCGARPCSRPPQPSGRTTTGAMCCASARRARTSCASPPS